jgi:hypothetical protein
MTDDQVGISISIKNAARAISEIKSVQEAIKSIGSMATKSNRELSAMSTDGLRSFLVTWQRH